MVIHSDLDLRSFRLQDFPEKPWCGVSPDSVTYCSCCKCGCLEVKCPLSLKEKLLKEEIHNGASKNRWYCDAWYQQSAGRITGSFIHQVYHTSVKKPSRVLIKRICQVHTPKLNTPAVAWGRDNEELKYILISHQMKTDNLKVNTLMMRWSTLT